MQLIFTEKAECNKSEYSPAIQTYTHLNTPLIMLTIRMYNKIPQYHRVSLDIREYSALASQAQAGL